MIEMIYHIIGTPLGWLMYMCYAISGSYGIAIILFTIVSKAILFPISILVQKNSIRMAKIQPQVDEIKQRYAGDKDRIADEQIKLHKKEKYSPGLGCLPMLLQLPLILGLIHVIYNPLTYILHIPKDILEMLTAQTTSIFGEDAMIRAPQLKIIEAVQTQFSTERFAELSTKFPDIMNDIVNINLTVWKWNLSETPSLFQPNILMLIPILSGLSALIMCLFQNRINILQQGQSTMSKTGMTVFLVAFSVYFPFITPGGIGFYWIFSNLTAIVVMFLVNMIYDPKKYIEHIPGVAKKTALTKQQKELDKQRTKNLKTRQRADNKQFYAEDNSDKQLVFYSAKSGFYKYFSATINYILIHSDIVIHYVTSDPDDAIFSMNYTKIIPYYIGEKALIPFMMKMDADMVVMTMPDLQKFHIKRSLVRKDIEYVYMFHTVASMHMTLREGAVDHYDTIFCVGPHQYAEIRKTEEIYQLEPKKLVECGYGLIDDLYDSYEKINPLEDGKKQILIAPSWQEGNIVESCLDELLQQLLGKGHRIIVRPHPELGKRFPEKLDAIMRRYQDQLNEDFVFEIDFSSNETIYQSDILITDWSNIAFEFSYCTCNPSLFINTPMKIMNSEYELLGIVPLDITLRDKIGVSVDLDQLGTVGEIVENMLCSNHVYKARIQETREQYLYNFRHSGEVAGKYIIDALQSKACDRVEEDDF